MAYSIAGIVINLVMLVLIGITIAYALKWNGGLQECQNFQSSFCYAIQCPCDKEFDGSYGPPCFGYTKRPGPKEGQWYCSNAYLQLVDDQGQVV